MLCARGKAREWGGVRRPEMSARRGGYAGMLPWCAWCVKRQALCKMVQAKAVCVYGVCVCVRARGGVCGEELWGGGEREGEGEVKEGGRRARGRGEGRQGGEGVKGKAVTTGTEPHACHVCLAVR